MTTQKPRITIVGLGLVGGSLGLALRQAGVASAVVGHDKRPQANALAKKLGAVDKTEWRLIPACEKADLVILATPVGAVKETLEVIGRDLRPGCVVLDTASIKVPVLEWAAQSLPPQVHFVGGDPILTGAGPAPGGLESARADLFKDRFFCLCPAPGADSDAVQLAINLVGILGARPLFYDPAEHDGLLAGVDQLPLLLSLALLETAIEQPTWRELRRVAGASFEAGIQAAAGDPISLGALCFANRDNLVRWIDSLSATLDSLRETLVGEGEAELAGRFGEALRQRDKWLQDRATGYPEDAGRADLPPRPSLMDSFLGTFWSRRMKREPKRKGE